MPTSPIVEGTKKITLVVITSDRGLAGAYNTNILKLAEIRKAEYEQAKNSVEIVTVGKKANGYFKYRILNLNKIMRELPTNLTLKMH